MDPLKGPCCILLFAIEPLTRFIFIIPTYPPVPQSVLIYTIRQPSCSKEDRR